MKITMQQKRSQKQKSNRTFLPLSTNPFQEKYFPCRKHEKLTSQKTTAKHFPLPSYFSRHSWKSKDTYRKSYKHFWTLLNKFENRKIQRSTLEKLLKVDRTLETRVWRNKIWKSLKKPWNRVSKHRQNSNNVRNIMNKSRTNLDKAFENIGPSFDPFEIPSKHFLKKWKKKISWTNEKKTLRQVLENPTTKSMNKNN